MSDTLRTHVDGEFDDVVSETIDALEREGFGVLCDIDVRETLEKNALPSEIIDTVLQRRVGTETGCLIAH